MSSVSDVWLWAARGSATAAVIVSTDRSTRDRRILYLLDPRDANVHPREPT